LISNRQGGRRRGRGGGGRTPNINPSAGNRQDNRQRGNAAQLLEKYRGLARDAQMQGDRVQTEFYLQFADHYYRLLNENRARFEEQRRQRGEGYDGPDEEEEPFAQGVAGGPGPEPIGREPADEEEEPRQSRQDRGERQQGNGGELRGRRLHHRDERDEAASDEAAEERIALDSLPPAISSGGDEGGDEPRTPRRRQRRPREPGEEIAPAA
jgi:hypothetical protein